MEKQLTLAVFLAPFKSFPAYKRKQQKSVLQSVCVHYSSNFYLFNKKSHLQQLATCC